MSCIITYKGQKYSEEQFKEYFINNKQEFASSISKNKDVVDSFKRKMEGINFVFSQSPELASIGSKAQYLQYLSTIFKTSKVKDIVYHWARVPFDIYDKKEKVAPSSDLGEFLNVSTDKYAWKEYASRPFLNKKGIYEQVNPTLQYYIINLINPYITDDYYLDKLNHNEQENVTEWFEDIIEKTYDGIIEDSGNQIAIFDNKNTLRLGSKQDIEGFKQFVNKNTTQVVDKNQLQKQNIEITNHNYTRQEVQNNPNTAYVFTENTYSITAFPNRAGGGSAIIRGLSNAFAIVTKKKYDYNTKENVDYTDTEVNFKEFTEVNTKLINELKNSGKEKIVFPQGFATDKAKMPTRFAEWLQKELLNNFGLITELNSTKTGLISKNISQVVDNGIDAKTLKRGDIIEFQQQNFQIERVTEEGFDVRDVNTGEVDFITKEDYESENKKELKPNVENNNDSPNEENWTEKNNDCGI